MKIKTPLKFRHNYATEFGGKDRYHYSYAVYINDKWCMQWDLFRDYDKDFFVGLWDNEKQEFIVEGRTKTLIDARKIIRGYYE
jgi:hypothetical protein